MIPGSCPSQSSTTGALQQVPCSGTPRGVGGGGLAVSLNLPSKTLIKHLHFFLLLSCCPPPSPLQKTPTKPKILKSLRETNGHCTMMLIIGMRVVWLCMSCQSPDVLSSPLFRRVETCCFCCFPHSGGARTKTERLTPSAMSRARESPAQEKKRTTWFVSRITIRV